MSLRGVQIACPRQEGVLLREEAFPLVVVCCWSIENSVLCYISLENHLALSSQATTFPSIAHLSS